MKIFNKIIDLLNKYYLHISYLVALTCMLISLYYSEIVHLAPCVLCWYQRILMYPLVLITFIAIAAKDRKAYKYILAMAVLGLVIALYHYMYQKFGFTIGSIGCSVDNPCNAIDVEYLGFITIPLMSAASFLAIVVVNAIAWRKDKKAE